MNGSILHLNGIWVLATIFLLHNYPILPMLEYRKLQFETLFPLIKQSLPINNGFKPFIPGIS